MHEDAAGGVSSSLRVANLEYRLTDLIFETPDTRSFGFKENKQLLGDLRCSPLTEIEPASFVIGSVPPHGATSSSLEATPSVLLAPAPFQSALQRWTY
ncbi:hypothetical protein B5K06_25365 [Rhizobium grahamii]|uniref:Uncharacterized protein n=1 Tax=Rhizobium grahamii TaxID=1120045 RepID=A0A370KIQ5_9HYPH|nr:hypothetical protein B5K06_25365 [Rhizobium grahamii]